MREIAFIALGANLGDRAAYLGAARAAVSTLAGTRILAASSVEETAPLGARPQQPYLNQMIAVTTALEPEPLLDALQRIERVLGRSRGVRWGARTIDLDIVRFGDRRMRSARLVVPHPGLTDRDFWRREVAQLEQLLAAA